MKILTAIISPSAATLKDGPITFAARAGYDMRIFHYTGKDANKPTFTKYAAAIDDLNYDRYLSIEYTALVTKARPMPYAKLLGYDLLLTLPADLKRWNKTKDENLMVVEFAGDVGRARKAMSKNKKLICHQFDNGATLERIK